MTLQQLNYVITISENGSFNKAAEVLYVAQPSLTSAVKELEKEMGIIIFNRGGKGVTLTADGAEFIAHAKQLYAQYDMMMEKYIGGKGYKKKFGISMQHYSFAVKSFVELVKKYNTSEYEFAVRETKTKEVIADVASSKSELGILYLSDFNKKTITRLLTQNNLCFHHLINCRAYVYLWRGHPLSSRHFISIEQLSDYPCLSFEQGDNSSFYFAEEILSANEYSRTIRATDRATMLNLMVGLNGYTLCSGIICEELNGDNYVAIPFRYGKGEQHDTMEIGYITRKHTTLSSIGQAYLDELKNYLGLSNIVCQESQIQLDSPFSKE